MIGFMIYMMDVADNISVIATIAFIALILVALVIGTICIAEDTDYDDDNRKINLLKILKTVISCLFVVGIIATFVPSSKTIAAMYVVPTIVNNEKIQNITGNGLELLEKYTKQWLDEMTDKKKENKKDNQ